MDETIEYFKPTSGRLIGSLGLVVAVGIIALLVSDGLRGSEIKVILALACFGTLMWAAMLRPRVGLSEDALVLRNLVSEVSIPLAAIEQLALRQVLAVQAGDRRYVSAALGRSLRSIRKSAGKAPDPATSYVDFVEERIRQRMEDARARSEVKLMSDEQVALAAGVQHNWAWPELIALIVTALGFAVALFF